MSVKVSNLVELHIITF